MTTNILEIQIVEHNGMRYIPVVNEDILNIFIKAIAATMKNRQKTRALYTSKAPRKQYKPDIIINTIPKPLIPPAAVAVPPSSPTTVAVPPSPPAAVAVPPSPPLSPITLTISSSQLPSSTLLVSSPPVSPSQLTLVVNNI